MCGESKPLSEFHRNRSRSDGLEAACKPCACARTKRWRERNAERVAAYTAAHRETRAPYFRKKAQEWRRNNPDRVKATKRAYLEAHPGWQERVSARWRELHPDYWREWNKANADKRRAYLLKRRKLAREASVVPFTPEQLAQRLSMFPGCWMCGGVPDCVDHVKPLSRGGLHLLANLRPACTDCNSAKRAQWPYDTRRQVA